MHDDLRPVGSLRGRRQLLQTKSPQGPKEPSARGYCSYIACSVLLSVQHCAVVILSVILFLKKIGCTRKRRKITRKLVKSYGSWRKQEKKRLNLSSKEDIEGVFRDDPQNCQNHGSIHIKVATNFDAYGTRRTKEFLSMQWKSTLVPPLCQNIRRFFVHAPKCFPTNHQQTQGKQCYYKHPQASIAFGPHAPTESEDNYCD